MQLDPTLADRRQQLLSSLGIDPGAAQEELDRITRLAQQSTGARFALITVLGDTHQFFKSRQGLSLDSTKVEHAFCLHTVERDSLFVVEDASRDPRFAENPLVTGPPGFRFYAGIPLRVGGRKIGALCVLDDKPGSISKDHAAVLNELGEMAEAELRRGRKDERVNVFRVISRIRALDNESPEVILEKALELGCVYLDMPIGIASLVDENGTRREVVATRFPDVDQAEAIVTETVHGPGGIGELNNAEAYSRWVEPDPEHGASIVIPVSVRGRGFAVLQFMSRGKVGSVSPEQDEFCELLAESLRDVLEYRELVSRLRLEQKLEKIFSEFHISILGSNNRDKPFDNMLEKLVPALGASVGLLVRVDPEKNHAEETLASRGLEKSADASVSELRLFANRAAREGIVINQSMSETDSATRMHCLAVPVRDAGRVIAVLGVSGEKSYSGELAELVKRTIPMLGRSLEFLQTMKKLQLVTYERERQLETLDKHAIVSISNIAGRITYANRRFCEVSGYTQEELLGNNHRMLKSGRHPEQFYRQMWGEIAAGRNWHGEICNRRKDGGLYWVESTITPFTDSEGRIYQYVSVRTEVTRLKEGENLLQSLSGIAARTKGDEYLRQSVKALAINLDVSSAVICLRDQFDEHWEITRWSGREIVQETLTDEAWGDTALSYLQSAGPSYECDDVVGKFPRDRFAISEGMNRCLGISVPDRPGSSALGQVMIYSSREIRDQDHKLDLLHNFAATVSSQVRKDRFQQELEKTYDLLQRSNGVAKIGTWEMDINSNAEEFSNTKTSLRFSEVASSIHGFKESDFAANGGATLSLYKEGKYRNKLDRLVMKAIENAEPFDDEFIIVTKSGEERWVRVIGLPKFDKGQCVELYGLVQDIEQIKLNERRLIEAKNEAERANKAKSEFLSAMSHELRTPLNAIIGFAQLLKISNRLTDKDVDHVGDIMKAGKHLLQVIDEVLNLTKVEKGAIEMTYTAVDMEAMVRDCIAMMSTMAKRRNVAIVEPGDLFRNVYVEADEFRLRQTLLNLMSNAIKYNRRGGSVELLCRTEQDVVSIGIRDTGAGIPQALQDQLFQPFSRLGRSDSEVEGSGIGLALSKQFVELMNGQIYVESDEGTGSTFWISLRQSAQRVPEPAMLESPAATSGGGDDSADKVMRMLYIEDNPTNLKLVEQIIASRKKIEFISAHNAELGLEIAMSGKPDAILVDINLPGMNGFDFCEKVRAMDFMKDVPLVAISANAMQDDLDRGFQVGFDHYLTKPLDVKHFYEVLDDIVGS